MQIEFFGAVGEVTGSSQIARANGQLPLLLREAGHIRDSSCIEPWLRENDATRKLVFSGDLGQYDSPILLDPYRIDQADLVLMETTYGDRSYTRLLETS